MTTRTWEPGELMRSPSKEDLTESVAAQFFQWLQEERDLQLDGWDALWRWSTTDIEGFWGALWDFFDVRSSGAHDTVLADRVMPGARWFPDALLNYAEHALGRPDDAASVAVVAHSQTRAPIELTFGDLSEQVARARAGLQRLGVQRGDRVVAYLPNIPETLVAHLAAASLGAVWASCAPELGARAVVDRFAQIEPTVLLAIAGYVYGTKDVDRTNDLAEIRRNLPTLRHVVAVPYGPHEVPDAVSWDDLVAIPGELAFERVPFDHPLVVLFSSGTTGRPKPIVHGHGGILLEHLKNHGLSWDLRPGDRLQWFTTTAWMMWNALVSALLLRASIVMIDGNPLHPSLDWQWQLAEETGATLLGASPGYLMACRAAGLEPARTYDLSRVRQLGSAGSPLPLEGFGWVQEQLGPEVLLNLGSGGTDVCSGLLQGSPLQPVWAGEMSGACLGVAAAAYDDSGQPVVGETGELVITEPMPSMPVGFWGDTNGSRYRAAYFDHFPGVWRHGDWVRFTERGSATVSGRSDATLNRGGVRLGTAEFYRVVEERDDVVDSLVVHLEDPSGGNGELVLFVVLAPGLELDADRRTSIGRDLRAALSPRHVPDTVVAVPAVPRTATGKKLELPVKRILQGDDPDAVLSRDALADPDALDAYVAYAQSMQATI